MSLVRTGVAGAVDDVCGHASVGEAPGVGAVVVVLGEVFIEVLAQGGHLVERRTSGASILRGS